MEVTGSEKEKRYWEDCNLYLEGRDEMFPVN